VGGPLARLRNGDRIRLDSRSGVLEVRVDAAEWEARATEVIDLGRNREGTGRELFDVFRANVTGAEEGAMSFYGSVPATASVPPVGVERAQPSTGPRSS
jgi:phosphogluconate dehydratase